MMRCLPLNSQPDRFDSRQDSLQSDVIKYLFDENMISKMTQTEVSFIIPNLVLFVLARFEEALVLVVESILSNEPQVVSFF
jgi:hypothetical protein